MAKSPKTTQAVRNPSVLVRPATVAQTQAAARLRVDGGTRRPMITDAKAPAAHNRSAYPPTPYTPLKPKPIRQTHAPETSAVMRGRTRGFSPRSRQWRSPPLRGRRR